MNANTTHLIQTYSSKEGHSCGDLFRLSDGMMLGRFIDDIVMYGEDPKELSHRAFIDESHAKAFLRRQADEDYSRAKGQPLHASIEEEPRRDRLVMTPQLIPRKH